MIRVVPIFFGRWTYGWADATYGRTAHISSFSYGRMIRPMTAFPRQVAPYVASKRITSGRPRTARGLIDRRWHRERSALSIIRLVAAARGACLRLGQCARGPTPYRGGHQPFARRMFIGAFTGPIRISPPRRAAREARVRGTTRWDAAIGYTSQGTCSTKVFHIFCWRHRCFKSLKIITSDNHRIKGCDSISNDRKLASPPSPFLCLSCIVTYICILYVCDLFLNKIFTNILIVVRKNAVGFVNHGYRDGIFTPKGILRSNKVTERIKRITCPLFWSFCPSDVQWDVAFTSILFIFKYIFISYC